MPKVEWTTLWSTLSRLKMRWEESAVGPFEPVQRDVPECSVAVGQKQPEGEAVGEEGEEIGAAAAVPDADKS